MTQRKTIATALTLSLVALATHVLRADVRADERTKVEFAGALGKLINIFGGKAAREGVTDKVAVKGDRKISTNDSTGRIIDLSEEKVYDLDPKKKTYKVTTFAELRRQLEEAQKKAQAAAQKPDAQPEKPKADQSAPPERQLDVDFDIKNTGQTKTINGFDAHEAVMTITVREKGKTLEQGGGMVMTADMWLAPTIKEMKEIQEFDRKYAQKLYGPMVSGASPEQMAQAVAMYPMMKPALAKMSAEGGKIDGTPVLTVMTMDSVKSAEQMAAEAKQAADAQQADNQSANPPTTVGSFIGGFAKKAAQKKMSSDAPPTARATFMTSTNEVLKVVTNVAPEDVALPASFKEAR
jgi:hypothetical protein